MRISLRPNAWGSLVGAAVVGFSSVQAHANTPLQHSFTFTSGLEFDSNPSLSVANASVQRWRANPQYTLAQKGGAAEWSLMAAGQIERSSNTAISAHRSDPSLRFTWQNASPQGSLGLNASYVQASTRAAEFEESGFVTADRTQTTQALGLTWRHALAERHSVNTTFNHQWVDYDTPFLTSYSTTGGSAGWSFELSAQESLSLALNASRYIPRYGGPGGVSSSSQWGVLAGYSASLTPTLQWQVQGGAVRVTGLNPGSTWQGNVQLSHKGARLDSTLSLGRSVITSATSTGFTPSNALRAQWAYAFSDRTNATFSIARTQTGSAAVPRTTASTMAVGVSTEITSFWRAGLNVQYKTSSRAAVRASAHVVSATLTYTHPDF